MQIYYIDNNYDNDNNNKQNNNNSNQIENKKVSDINKHDIQQMQLLSINITKLYLEIQRTKNEHNIEQIKNILKTAMKQYKHDKKQMMNNYKHWVVQKKWLSSRIERLNECI